MATDDRTRRAEEWPDDKTIRHRDRLRAEDFGIAPREPEKPDAVGRVIWGALILAALATLAGAALAIKAVQ